MNNKRNVLMLGVGQDQLPMIKTALEMGLGVIGLDGNPQAAGKSFCDHFETVDIRDCDKVEEAAIRLNKKMGIAGVITPAVDMGISVGRVVDCLGLRGVGEKTARQMTDKVERSQWLDRNDILQPKMNPPGFPAVIKPRDKAGAKGVMLIESTQELAGKDYDLIQEYLEGWELSVEVAILPDGNFLFVIADRNYDKKLKWKPYLLEDGCQLPTKLPILMQDKVAILIEKLVKIFQLRACVMKLDLIVKDNRVFVLECPPRLGGGKLSSIMIPKALGLNFWKLALKLAMGMPNLSDCMPPKDFKPVFCAQRYVFPANPTSHYDRITDFIETGTTYEEAIKKAEAKVMLIEST